MPRALVEKAGGTQGHRTDVSGMGHSEEGPKGMLGKGNSLIRRSKPSEGSSVD